jgi:hypothetical protein
MNPLLVAGATAAVMHQRSRTYLRRGLVYGVAGAITATEALFAASRGVAHGAEQVASSAGDLATDLVGEAQQARSGATGGTRREETRQGSSGTSSRSRQGSSPARRRTARTSS